MIAALLASLGKFLIPVDPILPVDPYFKALGTLLGRIGGLLTSVIGG